MVQSSGIYRYVTKRYFCRDWPLLRYRTCDRALPDSMGANLRLRGDGGDLRLPRLPHLPVVQANLAVRRPFLEPAQR